MVIFIFGFLYKQNFFRLSKEYLLTEHYTFLTMVYNIQIQNFSLEPCPSSNGYLKKNLSNTTFRKLALLPSSSKKRLSY